MDPQRFRFSTFQLPAFVGFGEFFLRRAKPFEERRDQRTSSTNGDKTNQHCGHIQLSTADTSALHFPTLTATLPAAFVVSQRLSPAASSAKWAGPRWGRGELNSQNHLVYRVYRNIYGLWQIVVVYVMKSKTDQQHVKKYWCSALHQVPISHRHPRLALLSLPQQRYRDPQPTKEQWLKAPLFL